MGNDAVSQSPPLLFAFDGEKIDRAAQKVLLIFEEFFSPSPPAAAARPFSSLYSRLWRASSRGLSLTVWPSRYIWNSAGGEREFAISIKGGKSFP